MRPERDPERGDHGRRRSGLSEEESDEDGVGNRSVDPHTERLDPSNPGPWVLHHHKPNLIMKLKKPKEGLLTRLMYVKCYKFQRKERRMQQYKLSSNL